MLAFRKSLEAGDISPFFSFFLGMHGFAQRAVDVIGGVFACFEKKREISQNTRMLSALCQASPRHAKCRPRYMGGPGLPQFRMQMTLGGWLDEDLDLHGSPSAQRGGPAAG